MNMIFIEHYVVDMSDLGQDTLPWKKRIPNPILNPILGWLGRNGTIKASALANFEAMLYNPRPTFLL